jgi:hypothetical protein
MDEKRTKLDAMRAELEDLTAGFNNAGLSPVVLKGAGWLMGHYAPHARWLISDLDLLCLHDWIFSTGSSWPVNPRYRIQRISAYGTGSSLSTYSC